MHCYKTHFQRYKKNILVYGVGAFLLAASEMFKMP